MKRIRTIATTATLLAMAAPALSAADEDKKFDGTYIGVETGIDWTKLGGDNKRDRNLYYGGVIGFRNQMDSGFVLGIEGTFGDNGYKNNVTGVHSNYEWSAGLTLGTVFGSDGDNMIYGKAAYVETNFGIDGLDDSSYSDGGWRFGGGYERSLSEKVSFRLGGDYTTYGDNTNAWAARTGLLFKF